MKMIIVFVGELSARCRAFLDGSSWELHLSYHSRISYQNWYSFLYALLPILLFLFICTHPPSEVDVLRSL